jgi:antitoxin MazE
MNLNPTSFLRLSAYVPLFGLVEQLKFFRVFSEKCNYFVVTNLESMKIPLIAIGNSKGIRLSKTILEKYAISEHVDIEFESDGIKIKPSKKSRQGWDIAFQKMHELGDDRLLIDDVLDENDWEL